MKIKHLLITIYVLLSAFCWYYFLNLMITNPKTTDWNFLAGLYCFAVCLSNFIPLLRLLKWSIENKDKKIF